MNFDQALEKEKKSILGFFIKNYRVTYLLLLAIFILGFYALFTLPREAIPEIKVPFAVVNTIYPGATPFDVEDLITDEIEEKIKNLDNLNQYMSSSNQGFSSIFVEFKAEADLKDSFQKLKDAVSQAEPFLPTEAERPQVIEIRFSDMPIVSYSLVSDMDLVELKKYADIIQSEIESIGGVSKSTIIGGLEREFQIIVDPVKLANFRVALNQIISVVSRTNFNMPSGVIEIDDFKYNVRVKGKFSSQQELEKVVLKTENGLPVYLGDVSVIKDTFKEKETESRIGFKNREAKNTISLQVFKKTGGNIINIVKSTDKAVSILREQGRIPLTITVEKSDDYSQYIKDDLNTLGKSGLQTMVLIMILLFIVLGLRGALISGFSVPIAFLMSFIFLFSQNQTLNSIVLFSLVISLGLMVDNSIIIMEGINEFRKKGRTPLESSLLSVWNFKWPIVSGALTTVAAFLPMLLVSGIVGEFFSYIPKTITSTLISSLFVALIIIPTLSSKFLKKNNGQRRYKYCSRCIDKLRGKYERMMKGILFNKKKRRTILFSAWGAFFLLVLIPASGLMKIEMFPQVDFENFVVNIKLDPGSSLEKTNEITKKVEKTVNEIPELKSYVTSLGSYMSYESYSGSERGTHLSTVFVNLVSKEQRKRKSFEIAADLREKLKEVKKGEIRVEEVQAGPPSGAPIEVRLFGDDLKDLSLAAQKIITALKEIKGTLNIKTSLENSTSDFTFTVKKERLSYFGLDTVSLASFLRTALYGSTISKVSLDGEDIDVSLRYNKERIKDADDLENLLIFTSKGPIPLKEVAVVSLEPSPLSIDHRDGERIITITSQIQTGFNLQKILKEFNEKDLNLPETVSLDIGGEIEEIAQSYKETFLSMILAVILIAFILVLQFNSFRQPFIIMFSLPLAIIGVIIGLNILRMPFSFTVFLGIVSLAGIGVNDAIVLIDRANKNIKSGKDRIPSLIEAGSARMQPIFLTSITTIAGVFPLIFADELWRGFSITLIFGLIASTSLTLIVIPILYNAISRKKSEETNFIQ